MPTALIGPAVSAVGGLFSKNAQDKANEAAAAQAAFNPFNISGAGGEVTFKDGAASVQGDAQSQMFQQGFGNIFSNIASGQAGNQGMIDFGNQIGANMGGFFNQAGMAGDPSSAINAANQFNQFAGQNAMFGQQAGMNQMGLANMFGTAQGGRNEALAQGAFGRASDAFGQDFMGIRDQTLANSRALARPAEDRAVNAKFQNLFSRGQLGTTGGANQIGALAESQEMADIQRQLSADQFANQLGQQNRMFGMQNLQQGQGFRSQDDLMNMQRAGLFGQMGQGMLGFGQGAGQDAMGSQFMANNLMNTRGQQRLQNAAQMFGFGQDASAQNFQQQLGAFGASSQGNADLRNLIALGGNLGSAGAQAGANQAQYTAQTGGSPIGSFLQGIGSNTDIFPG